MMMMMVVVMTIMLMRVFFFTKSAISLGLKGHRISPVNLDLSFCFDQVKVSSLSPGS